MFVQIAKTFIVLFSLRSDGIQDIQNEQPGYAIQLGLGVGPIQGVGPSGAALCSSFVALTYNSQAVASTGHGIKTEPREPQACLLPVVEGLVRVCWVAVLAV